MFFRDGYNTEKKCIFDMTKIYYREVKWTNLYDRLLKFRNINNVQEFSRHKYNIVMVNTFQRN